MLDKRRFIHKHFTMSGGKTFVSYYSFQQTNKKYHLTNLCHFKIHPMTKQRKTQKHNIINTTQLKQRYIGQTVVLVLSLEKILKSHQICYCLGKHSKSQLLVGKPWASWTIIALIISNYLKGRSDFIRH